ncbi:MAG TPA: ClpX C4-type zinc finger protein [Lacunisphaera sp.]|nr:ClpX C4-type zinc finger protein [Lacunisphaera sp.]
MAHLERSATITMSSGDTIKQLLADIRAEGDMKRSALIIEASLRESSPTLQETSKLEGAVRQACQAVLESLKAEAPEATCDFCQRPKAKVDFLVQGPLRTICDECIIVSQMAVDEARAKKKRAQR